MGNRRLAGVLTTVVMLMGASACLNGNADTKANGGDTSNVRITPANGTQEARPDQGVTVNSSGGKLAKVSVQQNGVQVPGAFNADQTQWKTDWTLKPGSSYSVSASEKGKKAISTSTFSTLKPTGTFSISDVTPMPGESVGVGMPIIVMFNRQIFNRDQVEKALEVKSDKGDVGRWHWVNGQEVVYRTEKYWQPHQNVTFTAHMAGVRGLKDVYGTEDVTKSFKIGVSNVTVANSRTHYMRVNHDGEVRRFPISTGNGSTQEYTTTSGIHLTKEKSPQVTMESPGRNPGDPGYYKEQVSLAVRISDRGEYVHQSVGEYYYLGKQNASHGCVRTSPTGAQWFYKIAQRGDIVDVTGTSRRLKDEQGNGWTFWTLSWPEWVQGSALPS